MEQSTPTLAATLPPRRRARRRPMHLGGARMLVRVAQRRAVSGLFGIGMVVLAGCSGTDHYLLSPHEAPPHIVVWSADFSRDQLRVHVEGARPPGPGPFPTILVHPEEDETATDMRGVIWDLAMHGYLALAFDYRRLIDGKYRRNLFVWRSEADVMLPIDVTRAYPEADQTRIGALGFSEGAVLSLLLAAHDPDRIKAVVCYYPITDFPHWVAGERHGLSVRVLFGLALWQLRSDSGAPNDEEYQKMLRLGSPYYMAEYIRAPVLLLHGAEDSLIPPEESSRMAEQLTATGGTAKLIVVPGGERFFNFRQPEQAALARDATFEWFDRYLRATPPSEKLTRRHGDITVRNPKGNFPTASRRIVRRRTSVPVARASPCLRVSV